MDSYEEQAVLTARFGYRVLVTVSVTALLLSLSPGDSRDELLEETRTLIRLAEDPLNWIEERALNHDDVQVDLASFESIARGNGLTLQLDTSVFTRIKYPKESRAQSMNGPTLEEIDEFYGQRHKVSVSVIQADSAFIRAVEQFKMIANVESGDTVRLSGSPSRLQFWWSGRSRSIPVDPPLEEKTYTSTIDPLEILHERPEARSLVERVNGDFRFLPRLRGVWDEVSIKSARRAREDLAQRYPPGEKQFEVFGLSIPQADISVAIPVLILAVSVYFFLHVHFLRGVIANKSGVRQYPWIGFIPGFISGVTLLVTVIVLPFGALVIAFIWFSSSVAWKFVSIVASLLAAAFLVCAYSNLAEIRNQSFRPFRKLCMSFRLGIEALSIPALPEKKTSEDGDNGGGEHH